MADPKCFVVAKKRYRWMASPTKLGFSSEVMSKACMINSTALIAFPLSSAILHAFSISEHTIASCSLFPHSYTLPWASKMVPSLKRNLQNSAGKRH